MSMQSQKKKQGTNKKAQDDIDDTRSEASSVFMSSHMSQYGGTLQGGVV
jgi:hypothetical protein